VVPRYVATREAEPELPIPEHRRRTIETFTEGLVQEARLLPAANWGFRLEEVTYDKIQMWHGTKDRNAPIQMVRFMAKRLPHCDLHEFNNQTHFTMGAHMEEVLDELMPKNALKQLSTL